MSALVAGGAGAAAAGDTTFDLRTNHVSIKIPRLPSSFVGYTIGLLCDFHFGIYLPHEWLAASVAAVQKARPDLIVLGGDFIGIPDNLFTRLTGFSRNAHFDNVPLEKLPDAIFGELQGLLRSCGAPDGVVAVLGNHDHWVSPKLCVRSLEAIGVKVITNETVTLGRRQDTLRIVGVDDYWSAPSKISVPDEPSRNEARVLVSHNPDFPSYLLRNTKFHFDLALCGHTHGGQMCLPGGVGVFYNVDDRRFVRGLASWRESQIYTSCGVGLVELPYRFNCPPEVTIFTLTA
jgi:predicted MPP superfamily phosphohydrolase